MGPETRRAAARAQTSVSTSRSPSPRKVKSQPKRLSKSQPRIDETIKTSRRQGRGNKKFIDEEKETIVLLDKQEIVPDKKLQDCDYDDSPASSQTSETSRYFSATQSPVGSMSQSSVSSTLHADEQEKDPHKIFLRNFDINYAYGSCRGITRTERYERAIKYKLKPAPPQEVLEILNEHKSEQDYWKNWERCHWDQYKNMF